MITTPAHTSSVSRGRYHIGKIHLILQETPCNEFESYALKLIFNILRMARCMLHNLLHEKAKEKANNQLYLQRMKKKARI